MFWAVLALDATALTAFQISGASAALRSWTESVFPALWAERAIYLTVFTAGLHILHGPVHFFTGWVWERRHGLSRQTFWLWLGDEIKKTLLNFLAILPLGLSAYALLQYGGAWWWVTAAAFWVMFSVFVSHVFPTAILPLFYPYQPLTDTVLRTRILALFKKAGVSLREVHVIRVSAKTVKANALLCGWGASRRVILTDTLLEGFSPEEIETVAAHELGHHVAGDLWRLTAVNAAAGGVCLWGVNWILQGGPAFGVTGPGDIAGLPMIVLTLMLGALVLTPVLNAFSRGREQAADAFALRMTQNPGAFMSLMEKLGQRNLAEFAPGRFDEIMFCDHPPMARRIAAAGGV